VKRIVAVLIGVLFMLFAAKITFAGANVFPDGARTTAMGKAGVTASDIFSVYNNQAGLGFLQATQAALHYENRFIASEMNLGAALFATPVKSAGTIGFDFCSFGYSEYRENRVGVAWGKRLSEYVSIGAQVCYQNVRIAKYGSTGAITAELGLLANPLEHLWIGAHVFNFTYSKFFSDQYHEPLPVEFNVGLSYELVKKATLTLQSEINAERDITLKSGLEFWVASPFAARLGVQLKPVQLYAGFGYVYKHITLDAAFSCHEVLGYTPQLSFVYNFAQKKK
jgi:hypothetical protein